MMKRITLFVLFNQNVCSEPQTDETDQLKLLIEPVSGLYNETEIQQQQETGRQAAEVGRLDEDGERGEEGR